MWVKACPYCKAGIIKVFPSASKTTERIAYVLGLVRTGMELKAAPGLTIPSIMKSIARGERVLPNSTELVACAFCGTAIQRLTNHNSKSYIPDALVREQERCSMTN